MLVMGGHDSVLVNSVTGRRELGKDLCILGFHPGGNGGRSYSSF